MGPAWQWRAAIPLLLALGVSVTADPSIVETTRMVSPSYEPSQIFNVRGHTLNPLLYITIALMFLAFLLLLRCGLWLWRDVWHCHCKCCQTSTTQTETRVRPWLYRWQIEGRKPPSSQVATNKASQPAGSVQPDVEAGGRPKTPPPQPPPTPPPPPPRRELSRTLTAKSYSLGGDAAAGLARSQSFSSTARGSFRVAPPPPSPTARMSEPPPPTRAALRKYASAKQVGPAGS